MRVPPVGWAFFGLAVALTAGYLLNRGVYIGSSIIVYGTFKDGGSPAYEKVWQLSLSEWNAHRDRTSLQNERGGGFLLPAVTPVKFKLKHSQTSRLIARKRLALTFDVFHGKVLQS
jgi:hypothetical protein